MALGGVATGSMNANEVAMVTGIMRYNGWICMAPAWKTKQELFRKNSEISWKVEKDVMMVFSVLLLFKLFKFHTVDNNLTEYINLLQPFNILRPGQNGRHFADDIFKRIFLNENIWITIKISLKFVPKGSMNNIPALVQKMAWRRPGDKPLFEPMMVNLPTHICVTRPQRVNSLAPVEF